MDSPSPSLAAVILLQLHCLNSNGIFFSYRYFRGSLKNMDKEYESVEFISFNLPGDYFSDRDENCVQAGKFISEELSRHLIDWGHKIPDWIKNASPDNFSQYLESEKDATVFQYFILFKPRETKVGRVAVRYKVKIGFWRTLFWGTEIIPCNSPIHEMMAEFGNKFDHSLRHSLSEYQALY